MFKLNSKGDLIAMNGFDGGTYRPQYESRTSVFLGDMTREDIRIKKEVQARKAAEARMDAIVRARAAQAVKSRIAIREYMASKNRAAEAKSDKLLNTARDQGFLRGYADNKTTDINPWVGSPFAGFGAAGEERINPDSARDIEIVDADIRSVREYGVQDWMQDPEALEARIRDSEWSRTEGKEILQTLVDYPQRPSESVVGMPVPSEVTRDINRAINTEAVMTYQAQQAAAAEEAQKPNWAAYGLIGLAILAVLK